MIGKIEQKVKLYLDKIKKEDKKINAFLELRDEGELLKEARTLDNKKGKRGKLWGYVVGVKSNINVRGLSASCASETLKDYRASYDATVIEKVKAEDGLIIGMLNMDEFACGSSGEYSAFGATESPAAKGCVAGGSSSGPAAAVAAGFCDVALGSDTGSSIRIPASFCGIYGIKTSYGTVSRYGLIDLSMSLDQIGPLAKSVDDCALVLDVIRGKDERDTKSTDILGKIYPVSSEKEKLVVGVLKVKGVSNDIQKLIDAKVEEIIEETGWKKKEVDVKHIELGIETYFPLVYTEFFSATRRFDGRKYGKKIEDSAGAEVLRRIYGGSEVARAESAGRYYHKALGVKELIKKEFEKAFEKVDCVMIPTAPVLPWKIGKKISPEEMYAVDLLTAPINLAEACAISVPVGFLKEDGIEKPVGMQIVCAKGDETKMLRIAKSVESLENI